MLPLTDSMNIVIKKKLTLILITILAPNIIWSVETCSRTAIINYQKILVDINTTHKGEGLRYYLEKDTVVINEGCVWVQHKTI